MSSTTGMAKKPLVRLPMQSSPLSSTSPVGFRKLKAQWRTTTRWFFPVELEDLSLIAWIYPSTQKRA